MKSFWKSAAACLFIVMLAASFCPPQSSAQTQADVSTNVPQAKEANTGDGWHFEIMPYMWFASVHGTAGALGHEASVHASFSDIFNYLNLGAMGTFEARYNRVIMPVDFLWMKLSDEQGLPITDNVDSVKATMRETLLTPKIGYRIADGKKVKVDAFIGARYWHLNTELRGFAGGSQVGKGFSQSANWADAIAGGRITLALSPKAFVEFGGDAGGGSARSDYQVAGILGYKISRRWVLMAGYRYLSVDYRPNGKAQFVFDVDMPGAGIGATFNIK